MLRGVVLLLVVFVAACGPSVDETSTGAEIYQATCAGCHGAELKGQATIPALGAGSPVSEQPRQYLVDTITNGRSRMPSFGHTLTETQIESVVDFVMDQQGR